MAKEDGWKKGWKGEEGIVRDKGDSGNGKRRQ